ncbi:uncharacterized protein LOC130557387 [Triplophysa rosa]|uniref:AIG1-type G domain-containing protein n=1 Tax=Triplophysa rosa TaxID=992332 RepID=A0A9W7WSM5_TRIRA|nr:uncharacterized protein LOC130557387 [Triplophysa rosa]KAI7807528.1 hypothetical protein IRJ41_005626 [Triplophysa rosa]
MSTLNKSDSGGERERRWGVRQSDQTETDERTDSTMDFSSQVSDLCLVLVGSIGCGKTLTTDTLLGQSSHQRPSISSRECQVWRALSEGRSLSVVETPRWYWRGGQVEADIQAETRRAIDLSAPGPLVFLILIPVGEFTEMEQKIPDQLEQMFGRSVLHHTLVLLTCGDYLMSRSLHEYLRQEEGLQEVLRRCHGRCHVINNRRPHDRQQVITLLEEVEQMIQMNGGFVLNRDQEMLQKSQPKLNATATRSWSGLTDQTKSDSTEETGSDAMIESRLVNGLHSQPYESEQTQMTHSPLERSSSFKLNRDGAILSNMLEVSESHNNQNFINTIHHSIRKVVDSSETFSAVSSSDVQNDSSLAELRMILLGRRGSGKSEAGNIILGCDVFERHTDDGTAAPQQCVKGQTIVQNQLVSVVDTPDWFDSERSPEEVKRQISRCLFLSAPGPHIFLMCVPVNRPAHSELPALRALEGVFGPDAVRRHTLVLFTHSDLLPEAAGMEGVEAYIASRRPEMLELVQKCGDRYHVLQRKDRGGVPELLDKVQQTVRESGGGYYSSSLDREAGSGRQEEISTVRRDRQLNLSHPLHDLKETEEEEELAAGKNIHLDSVVLLSSSTSAQTPSLFRSVCEKAGSGAKRVPKVLAVGALLGAALGVFLSGAVGGAVGAALGAVVCEVGRRRYSKQKTQ